MRPIFAFTIFTGGCLVCGCGSENDQERFDFSSSAASAIECDDGAPCPPDWDGDGILDFRDNCPGSPNPGQEDCDGDGWGDVCDAQNGNDVFAERTPVCYVKKVTNFCTRFDCYASDIFVDASACGSPPDHRTVSVSPPGKRQCRAHCTRAAAFYSLQRSTLT